MCSLVFSGLSYVSASQRLFVHLLGMAAFFTLSYFFLADIDSHGTLHLALGLVGMHSATMYIWAIKRFHISHSENIFQMSPEDYQTCFLHLWYIHFLYNY